MKIFCRWLLLFLIHELSLLACWMSPSNYSVISENGQFSANIVQASSKQNQPHLVVYQNDNSSSWSSPLINETLPSQAHISNDGNLLVTVGNWFGKDDGNAEIAIYENGQMLFQYSKEELLGNPSQPDFRSTAGQEWMTDNLEFFNEKGHFCIWVDFRQQWFFIDTYSGKISEHNAELVKDANQKARSNLLKEWQKSQSPWIAEKLLRFLQTEDRPLFEQLLKSSDQNLSCGSSSSNGKIKYFSVDRNRQIGEVGLLLLDGLIEESELSTFHRSTPEKFRFMGQVELQVNLEYPLSKNDGILVFWLKNITAEDADRPLASIGIDLKYKLPYKIRKGNDQYHGPINITFQNVPPGTYHVHGYHNLNEDMSYSVSETFWKSSGNANLSPLEAINVKARKKVTISGVIPNQ